METAIEKDLQTKINDLVAERLGLELEVEQLREEIHKLNREQTALRNALLQNARKLRPLLDQLNLKE